MAQLTGSQRRTTHTLAFVAGGLVASAAIAVALALAGALGVRVQVPAVGDAQGVVQVTVPAPDAAPRMRSYDGRLDPVELAYILESIRPQGRSTGAQTPSSGETPREPGRDLADDLARWRLVAK